jgi:Cu-Zn family superoxide dismutase
MKRYASVLAVTAIASLAAGCGEMSTSSEAAGAKPAAAAAKPAGPTAVATLQPTTGNATAGTAWFTQQPDGVLVRVKVSGLKPNQEHGFHAHEKGDCSSGDGMSTGGHFNPAGKPHGPQHAEHHAGDFPALKADGSGNVETTFKLTGATVGTGAYDLIGKGLIVHANPDDYKTQPTGNAGARIACGVIKAG